MISLDYTAGHDDVRSDYVMVYPSINVSGNVEVGEETELKIGKLSIICAGTVSVKDIPERCIAVGRPAKPINSLSEVLRYLEINPDDIVKVELAVLFSRFLN